MKEYVKNFERNRMIVLKYLLNDSVTLQSIGDEHRITRERVRQILERYGISNNRGRRKKLLHRRLKFRSKRLYDFLIEYKKNNDGNTPGTAEMVNGSKLSTTTRVDGCLIILEQDGLIEFSKIYNNGKSRSKTQINIVGAKWIPPK